MVWISNLNQLVKNDKNLDKSNKMIKLEPRKFLIIEWLRNVYSIEDIEL